jgi:hypothetical protein
VLGVVGLFWNDEYINRSRWFVRAGLCSRPGQLCEISPGTDLKPLERKGFVTAIDDPAPSGKITGALPQKCKVALEVTRYGFPRLDFIKINSPAVFDDKVDLDAVVVSPEKEIGLSSFI